MAKKNDFQVILPYSKLCELLNSVEEVTQLRQEVLRLSNQQAMLRFQFMELAERFRELE